MLPVLLRGASAAYRRVVRAALEGAGFHDLPTNGPLVLAGVAEVGVPLARVVDALGVSKQAAGQLVELLVARDYLDRSTDPVDRRRLTVTLTDRGRAAASVIRAAIEGVDAEVAARVGLAALDTTRDVLGALLIDGAGGSAMAS